MATVAAPRRGKKAGAPANLAPPETARGTVSSPPPVKYWAFIGAVMLIAEAIFVGKWVFGPNFERVSSGPDSPPGWMKTEMLAIQIIAVAATLFTVYWFIVRPWRSERRVSTDGLLIIAFFTISFFDPLSNYVQDWFTYNSYLVNMGSVIGDIPGATSFNQPGANSAFPLLIVPTAYVTAFIWLSILGCKIMSAAKRRWPSIGPGRLIAVCLAFTILADVVIEGIFYMPLGFWTYAGGHWAINPSHYYRYPMHSMVFGGTVFASFVCLRYFTNDKGQTIAERGIDRIKTTQSRKVLLRGLAIVAFVHLGFVFTYHLPQALFGSINSGDWPADVQERSYFTNNICGPDTDRACPGPAVPITRPDSPFLKLDGGFGQPAH